MSETTTAVTNTTKKAADRTAAVVAETLPTVVETVEVAMEMPAKVVLNQKLVVTVAVIAGAGLGAGALWGVNKWRMRNKTVIVVPETVNDESEAAEKA